MAPHINIIDQNDKLKQINISVVFISESGRKCREVADNPGGNGPVNRGT